MRQYLDIVRNVLNNGMWKAPVRKNEKGEFEPVDGGIKTLGLPNVIFSHNMWEGFPLLTSKKMATKAIRVELEGFLKGVTDKRWFQERGCHIWDLWCNPAQLPNELVLLKADDTEVYRPISGETKKKWMKENPDLGPLGYSFQWRSFNKKYKPVPFIWTGLNTDIVVADYAYGELIGKTYNGKYGIYTVINSTKNKYKNTEYIVKFHKTGFVKDKLTSTQVKDSNIFDPYYPNLSGVACVGDYQNRVYDNISNERIDLLKNQWRAMIRRCYDPNHPSYKNYGAQNVYVCNRWLVFEFYLEDIQQIRGWKFKCDNWDKYHLDKDILGENYYSKNTCLWVSIQKNANHTKQNYYFDAISPDNKVYKNMLGLNQFCKQHKLVTKTVEASIRNDTYTHNGWKFIRKQQYKKQETYIDQLANIVDTLKNNPNDRRMVVSAWNPNQTHSMALPPCHYSWNVSSGPSDTLNLLWSQRSCDLMLGVPFNIASYAFLLLLLCEVANLKPGNLTGVLVDCHIYENQIEAAIEQLTREPRPLPQVEIVYNKDEDFDIFKWTHKDVKIINYNPHPKLNFGPPAV